MLKHVGFIGLGKMGMPMATRLMDAGYTLSVHDVNRKACDTLAAKGARIGASPAAIGSEVDTVLLSLPNPAIVREVALGAQGLIAGAKLKTMIDLSTTGASAAREIAAALAAKRITAGDSPVKRGVTAAGEGPPRGMGSGP